MPTSLLRWIHVVAPLMATIALLAEEPQRATLPATANVESRTYQQDGRKVTERVVTTTVRQVEAAAPKRYKAAIFVTSNAGSAVAGQLGALEDLITSGVTEQGLSVISRDTALNAVRTLDGGRGASTRLDEELASSTSAVRLAQTLGADVVLHVTVTGYDSRKNKVDAYGVHTTNDERTLRVSYKLLDGGTGASLAADTVSARRSAQASATSSEANDGLLGDLMEEAAGKVAQSVKRRLDDDRLSSNSAAQGLVTVTIATEAADLMIPDVRIGAENTVALSESKFKVSPLSVTIEVDGVAVGSAPGSIQVKPGLSKLRLTRDGFKPWERTINATNGLSLVAALQLSEEGYARWRDATAFINDLKNGAKLTDGEARALEGKARMLEQSGFRVNTTQGVTIKETQSLFSR
jgi:hypothetical protein